MIKETCFCGAVFEVSGKSDSEEKEMYSAWLKKHETCKAIERFHGTFTQPNMKLNPDSHEEPVNPSPTAPFMPIPCQPFIWHYRYQYPSMPPWAIPCAGDPVSKPETTIDNKTEKVT